MKDRAFVLDPKLTEEDIFSPTFETQLFAVESRRTGMKVECSCKRTDHGQLCDHVLAHFGQLTGFDMEDWVHLRDTRQFYHQQYPLFGFIALQRFAPHIKFVSAYGVMYTKSKTQERPVYMGARKANKGIQEKEGECFQ